MTSEDEIRTKIRHKIDSGTITEDKTVWGGPSTGMICSACDEQIRDGGEVEVLCVDGQERFYHSSCFLMVTTELCNRRKN